MNLKIVSYGEHMHPQGLQVIRKEDAEAMVRFFDGLRGKLMRRFGGLPIYVGHPDDPAFGGQHGHTDTRAHGWVTALDAAEDGLWATVKWAESGREILRNAHYKFVSPRWVARKNDDGSYTPVRLLSLGLTNEPNIPGEAICNSRFPARAATLVDEDVIANAKGRAALSGSLSGRGGLGVGREAFMDAVRDYMSREGVTYPEAWSVIKHSRTDLYEEMES